MTVTQTAKKVAKGAAIVLASAAFTDCAHQTTMDRSGVVTRGQNGKPALQTTGTERFKQTDVCGSFAAIEHQMPQDEMGGRTIVHGESYTTSFNKVVSPAAKAALAAAAWDGKFQDHTNNTMTGGTQTTNASAEANAIVKPGHGGGNNGCP